MFKLSCILIIMGKSANDVQTCWTLWWCQVARQQEERDSSRVTSDYRVFPLSITQTPRLLKAVRPEGKLAHDIILSSYRYHFSALISLLFLFSPQKHNLVCADTYLRKKCYLTSLQCAHRRLAMASLLPRSDELLRIQTNEPPNTNKHPQCGR